MKNYLIVFNSITACLLFGVRFFSAEEKQGITLLCWLVYTLLILLPALFSKPWIVICCSVLAILLLLFSKQTPEPVLLAGFQITVISRNLRIPYAFRLLPYILFGPLIPLSMLHIYIFSAFALFVFDLILDLMQKRKDLSEQRYSELRQKADDLAEKFEQQADLVHEPGLPRLEKLMESYGENHDMEFTVIGTEAAKRMPQKVWNAVVNNAQEFLINSIRHSGGKRITISFNEYNKFKRIDFFDNGQACEQLQNGAGLDAMHRRTEAAGGTLIVKGLPRFAVVMLFKGEEI